MAAILTFVVWRYARVRQVLDIPNERSAHTAPTPRGGGIAIAIAFMGAAAALAAQGFVERSLAQALVGAGTMVALIGFLDDHSSIAPARRLVAHFVAAAWVLVFLNGFPPIGGAGVIVDLGWAGHVAGALLLVWLLNLYNFMDGIDGVAAGEAVTVGASAALLYSLDPAARPAWLLPALLAAAAFGFLVWNWPPARIFMGDAGSGFLGVTCGALAIQGAWIDAKWLWIWGILLGVFIVDATVTLWRRIRLRQRLHEAHRTHAYQNATQYLGAHRPVTLTVCAINLVWLLPMALLVTLGIIDGIAGLVVAYVPLVVLALRWSAGGVLAGRPPS